MLDDEAARGLRQGAHAPGPIDRDALIARLAAGGFVAPEEEADELLACPSGDVEELVRRRETGEPLAWITGRVEFCGLEIRIDPGVYVPRWHTEALARRAAAALPAGGIAIDLCTGSGAVAAVLAARLCVLQAGIAASRTHTPGRVVAADVDPRAVACARRNAAAQEMAFEAVEGDLFAAVPADLRGAVDVVVAVVPYVPTPELPLLQRDTLTFESPRSYDGGPDGMALLRRVVAEAPDWLKPGGTLLLELGGDQADALDLSAFTAPEILHDDDGDARGIIAALRA